LTKKNRSAATVDHAGVIAGSISLIGFGMDSFIEVTSGAVLLWRMSVDAHEQTRERNERLSLRIVGICFLALASYVAFESVSDLIGSKASSGVKCFNRMRVYIRVDLIVIQRAF